MASVVREYDVMVKVVAAEVDEVQVAVCVVDHEGRDEGLVFTVEDCGTAGLTITQRRSPPLL